MKSILATAILGLAILPAMSTASAQNPTVQATVPFAFVVGGKLLPANTYTVSVPQKGVMLIQSVDRRTNLLTIYSSQPGGTGGEGKLVFDKYEDRYYLRAVRCSASGINARIGDVEAQGRNQQRAGLRAGSTFVAALK